MYMSLSQKIIETVDQTRTKQLTRNNPTIIIISWDFYAKMTVHE